MNNGLRDHIYSAIPAHGRYLYLTLHEVASVVLVTRLQELAGDVGQPLRRLLAVLVELLVE